MDVYLPYLWDGIRRCVTISSFTSHENEPAHLDGMQISCSLRTIRDTLIDTAISALLNISSQEACITMASGLQDLYTLCRGDRLLIEVSLSHCRSLMKSARSTNRGKNIRYVADIGANDLFLEDVAHTGA